MKSKATGCGSISTVFSSLALLCVSSIIIIIIIIIIMMMIMIIVTIIIIITKYLFHVGYIITHTENFI